ncbi:MAG: helix-turn-helix domain-containing protein [Gemmatimonas sp.]
MTLLQLQTLRKAAGLSQEALAQETGTTQRTISRLESGDLVRPDLELLVRICEVLEITMDDLLPIGTPKRKRG